MIYNIDDFLRWIVCSPECGYLYWRESEKFTKNILTKIRSDAIISHDAKIRSGAKQRREKGEKRMKTLKDKIFAVIIVIVVAVGAVSLLTSDLKHIEDTNGPDNYALQTITDADIIRHEMGCLNLNQSEGLLSDTITYSSDKFTGVSELYRSEEIVFSTGVSVTVNHAAVDAGNFRIVLVHEDQIIHEFALNELSQTHILEDFKGRFSLVIAGESADFSLDFDVH